MSLMKFLIIVAIAFVLLIPVTAFAQYLANSDGFNDDGFLKLVPVEFTKFYSNEKYDFSLKYPKHWDYKENVAIIDGRVDEVIFFPSEYSISDVGEHIQSVDVPIKLLGWPWQHESPVIGMDFETISTSDIEIMSEESVREYIINYLDQIPSTHPPEIYSKTHSYGWEVGVTYHLDIPLGPKESISYIVMEKAFFFKDRQKYNLYYGGTPADFENFKYHYDEAVDTLIIKSVAVPEFGSIAMLILVVSVVSIVVIFRKFNFLVLR